MIKNIDAVIVTYGNRWNLLEENIKKIIRVPEIANIIIIDNNSQYYVSDNIKKYFLNQKNINVIRNDENLGSAGGFKRGIIESEKKSGEFILLLDDDTYIEYDAIKKLNRDIIKDKIDIRNSVFTFNRDSWSKKEKYEYNDIKNSFFEFSIFNKMKKTKHVSSHDLFQKKIYVPYAGFLFNKKYLSSVQLPCEKYYLYVDDTKFTYGFFELGIQINCYLMSDINELESSWAQQEEMPFFKAIFYTNKDNFFRAAYNIRNRANFEKNNTVDSHFIYSINRAIYLNFVFLKYMPKNRNGIRIFLRIITLLKLGYSNSLGKNIN